MREREKKDEKFENRKIKVEERGNTVVIESKRKKETRSLRLRGT